MNVKQYLFFPSILLLLQALLFALVLAGCAFFDLEDDLKEYEAHYVLSGRVKGKSSIETPVVVALYKQADQDWFASQYLMTDATNHFSFLVTEGVYSLAAFEDQNENFSRDNGEIFGFYDQAKGITVDAEEMLSGGKKSLNILDIVLKEKDTFPVAFPSLVGTGEMVPTSTKKIGVLTDLDDKIFNQENGSLGYWKPFAFLQKIGIGIYFLEEYDPEKIPVLFVHGALGTPVGWKPILAKIDRKLYQPWFFYYPSGFRLGVLADALDFMVRELHWEHDFTTLHVISHSMGGLVSRAFILKNVVEEKQTYIDTFISMSTPWGGINTAAMGVKHAPAVIPNWYDLSPDSEFIQKLYENSLPGSVKFHLLFGVRGNCSMIMANNDGTVEIASEIDYRAQADAAGFYGFDEDHGSIMTSMQVTDLVKALLEKESHETD